MTPDKKILSARTQLMINQPFFAALAVQMGAVDASGDPRIDTAATDGRSLFYNPDFIASLKGPEVQFVLAHEVLHVALEHHIRRGQRDPKRWNIACDYVINWELNEAGVGKMPKCGLLDETYADLSAEEVYSMLPEDAGRGGSGGDGGGEGGADPGGCGGILDACAPHDEAAKERISAEVRTMVRQAANIAKASNAGNLPGNIARLIEKLLEPKVDWRAELRRFVDQVIQADYSWMRPNRRYLPHRLIMPSVRSDEALAHVVICVDTSGSIDDATLQAFGGEINGIFGDGFVDRITVIYCDTDVARVEEFNRGEELELRAAGGGGTAFSRVFRFIADEVLEPSVTVFFTDLLVDDFGDEPACPVLWAVQGSSPAFEALRGQPPFGEAISLAEAA